MIKYRGGSKEAEKGSIKLGHLIQGFELMAVCASRILDVDSWRIPERRTNNGCR